MIPCINIKFVTAFNNNNKMMPAQHEFLRYISCISQSQTSHFGEDFFAYVDFMLLIHKQININVWSVISIDYNLSS